MTNIADTILKGLNPQQREAVETVEGPLLIIAGPGSGKTRVITHRIAYLVRVLGVSPRRIMAVTFTNKAAREMVERLTGLLGDRAKDLTVGTFHALGARILRQHGEAIGVEKDFVIYDDDDQRTLVKRCLEELQLDPKQFTPQAVLSQISAAKNQMLTVGDMASPAHRRSRFEEVVYRVYELYEQRLKQAKALDFDDLLFRTALLFQRKPDVLKTYQDRYMHVMVDEFQDTNVAQYTMMQQIAAGHGNICVVGDPDQSIYSWRYADLRNILNFEKDHPDTKTVILGQNYRSTKHILEAAQVLISANKQRKQKDLWTDKDGGEPVVVMELADEQEEARAVASEINRLEREKLALPGDCAVMYRTNAQSRALEESFNLYGIPYRLIGGLRFWERREVKDVVAYLKVLQNPYDDLSLERIINVPARSIGDKTIDQLKTWANQQKVPLYAATQAAVDGGPEAQGLSLQTRARTNLQGFLTLINGLMELSEKVDVAKLLVEMTERTGYRKALLEEEDGEDRWDNVQELRTVAGQFQDLEGREGLVAFLESAMLASDQDSVQEGEGAVTLITLHQAKGLEYPVVFMVGLEEGILPHQRSFDDPAAMEEERRICYVGMTRAKERLYLSRASRRTLFGGSMINPPSRYLKDIADKVQPRAEAAATRVAKKSQSPTALRPPAVGLRAGDHVKHLTFGEGIVIGVLPQGGDYQVTVAFKGDAGVKRLMYSYANLEKV